MSDSIYRIVYDHDLPIYRAVHRFKPRSARTGTVLVTFGCSVIPRLHDEANIIKHRANIEQTSSKHQAIRPHVMHMYFEYICLMIA